MQKAASRKPRAASLPACRLSGGLGDLRPRLGRGSFRFFCRPSPKICNAGPRVALGLVGCLSASVGYSIREKKMCTYGSCR